MIPKKVRYQNKAYIEFIKQQPCCITGYMGVDPHHDKSRGSGGSDLTAIPLKHNLHVECHQIGRETFQSKYNIDFKEVRLRLLEEYIMRSI